MTKRIGLKQNGSIAYPSTIINQVMGLKIKSGQSMTSNSFQRGNYVVVFYSLLHEQYIQSQIIPKGFTNWISNNVSGGDNIHFRVVGNTLEVSSVTTVKDYIAVRGFMVGT